MMEHVQYTERGFEFVDFTDLYDESCSLQQSSIALSGIPGTSAIWLGPKGGRMHLDQQIVRQLVILLGRWLETGSFKEAERVQ